MNKSKKRLILQGELIVKQKKNLEVIPRAGKKEENRLIQQAAQHEVAAARIAELEARNTALEEGGNHQKDMIQSIHEEPKERLGAVESRNNAIRSVNIHLESTIMELQERIERMLKNRGLEPAPAQTVWTRRSCPT